MKSTAKLAFVSAFVMMSLCLHAGAAGTGSPGSNVPVQVDGFVDAQFQWANAAVNGFTIPSGRVHLSKEFRGGVVHVSLPFAYGADASSNHSFAFAGAKTEAYVEYRFDSGFFGRLGQFASLFGQESVWMDQVVFSSRGVISESLPYVHTGAVVGFGPTEMLTIRLLASNRSDYGVAGGRGPDLGIKMGVKTEIVRFQAGYLLSLGADATARSVLDILLGTTAGLMSLDLGFNLLPPTASVAATGFGIEAALVYAFIPTIHAGVRFDYGKNIQLRTGGVLAAAATDTAIGVTVGPQFALTPELKLKTDYTLGSVTASAGATSTVSHAVAVAGVYSF